VYGDNTVVVHTGDAIDKGPQSAQNVEALIRLRQQAGIQDVINLMGNHELWITQFLQNPAKLQYVVDWIQRRGGAAALRSYEQFAKSNPDVSSFSLEGFDLANMPMKEVVQNGHSRYVPDNTDGYYTRLHQAILEGFPKTHLDFFGQLRSSASIGDYYFAHAGVDPKRPLQDQGLGALTWIRDPYLNYKGTWLGGENKIVVSGHTILKRPLIKENQFVTDLGSFLTSDFMAVILKNDLIRFVILRDQAEPVFTDIRDGFDRNLFAPAYDPSEKISNPKKR